MAATIHDLPTPALIVDRDKLARNIDDMAAFASRGMSQ